jgi:hypothetical protein
MESVTIAAHAGSTLGETVTLHAPEAWHDRIRQLEAYTVYGPNFSRGALENLLDMSRLVHEGYSSGAYDYLCSAERCAGIVVSVPSGWTDKQVIALSALCGRYKVEFDPDHYAPAFDLPDGYVAGWVGGEERKLYVGCSPEGEISS